jgi:hypothetical protein
MSLKNTVRTSKRTPHFTITTINWLMLFKEITFNYPFEDETCLNVIKNSVRTSKRTPHFTITKINWLMLFKEIIFNYPFEDERERDRKGALFVVRRFPGYARSSFWYE